MRYKKKELLSIVDTLKKANRSIGNTGPGKVHGKTDFTAVKSVLSDCLQAAAVIGSYLETQEKSMCPLITLLESYSENLYKQSSNWNNRRMVHRLSEQIHNQLCELEMAILHELPEDKKEIVFLPYKASMWDSMESVYFAAKQHADCEVYCVPVPYFDRNPDRTDGQMHYEGGAYPKDVEITDWRTYRLEERRPDMIFIHSPYDSWNLVTSVHPEFYSDKLKQFTEMLVYIPYFVLGDMNTENQRRIDKIKNFCFLPGIINADRVIVESEQVRQIYINEYMKAAKEIGLKGKHLDRKYLEEKICGLGSPKFDRINNAVMKDTDLPEEWIPVIKKADGSRKKVILYNTSITALLEYDHKWMDKIEDSLCVFRNYKDEIALLWRPHPLIEATMRSMRQEILLRYTAVKETYRKEAWGIFDDTANMDRAIALSSGYYGDRSSVAKIYEKTGKPMMYQDIKTLWKNGFRNSPGK